MNFKQYLDEFDKKFENIKEITKDYYTETLGVKVGAVKKSPIRDKKGNLSEEYIRARFVYALVNSGMYPKEYICVEFPFPKGNTKGNLTADIVIFKNRKWAKDFEQKDYKNIRQNLLVICETKKNNGSVEKAVEKQLRPAMQENESDDRIFGIYFDNKDGIIIFKKLDNAPIRRFFENKELFENLNLENRDLFSELPKHTEFINNNKSISDLTKLKIDCLDAIDETNFTDVLNSLKRAQDKIKPKHHERDLIVEFLTLKIFDEKRAMKNKGYLKFYILTQEKINNLKQFRERINKLYSDAERHYKNVLNRRLFSYSKDLKPSDLNDEKFLIEVIEIFQKRAILKARNESFNQIIFNNFGDDKQKADKGQYFTPIPVVKTIINMLNPVAGEELCDPCCGICDFPAMAFIHSYKNKDYPDVASHFYGFDMIPSNLKLAELNLVLNCDGGATLHSMNSLTQKLLQDESILQEGEFTKNNYDKNWEHKNYKDKEKNLKKYDIIATNPPFGKGRDLKTGKNDKWDIPKETIELYETWKLKKGNDKNLPNSMDTGVLFLENAYKLLKEGGRMGIVLSNSIASIKEWENIRKWFFEKMRLVATFDLPANTFGETGVATTIVIAYKPKHNEKYLLNVNYEVFIKDIENIGYEVKTKKRSIHFQPKKIINEDTFEKTNTLDEDFTKMIEDFTEYLKRQEVEIKNAFHLDDLLQMKKENDLKVIE